MGNKQSKGLYDAIEKTNNPDLAPTFELSMETLSQTAILDHWNKSIISKILKSSEIQDFEKNSFLNLPLNQTAEEYEGKKKKYKDFLYKSLLVAGHEQQLHVGSVVQTLEEAPTIKLSSSYSYTHSNVSTFICSLLLMRQAAQRRTLSAPFETRLANYLLKDKAIAPDPDISGVSASLKLTSFLLDPKRILAEPQLLSQALRVFRDIPPLSLYGWTREALILDRAIDQIKACLKFFIEDSTNANKELIPNAILALCHVGLSRGSLEDILLAIYFAEKKTPTFSSTALHEIIERLIFLPEDLHFSQGELVDLDTNGIREKIPFEKLYIQSTPEASKESNSGLSSATDGNYVYLYTKKYGIQTISCGKGKMKGQLLNTVAPTENIGELKLVCLNKILYGFSNSRFFQIDPKSGEMKEIELPNVLSFSRGFVVTNSKDKIALYIATKGPIEKDTCSAEVFIYDNEQKTISMKYQIEHNIMDVHHIILNDDIILLVGCKKYEVFDLKNSSQLFTGDSSLLKVSTICLDPITKEFNMIYLLEEKDGLQFARLKPMHLTQQTSSFEDENIKKLKESLQLDKNAKILKQKKQVAAFLGFYGYGSEDENEKKAVSENASEKWNTIVSILASRARLCEGLFTSANIEKPEEALQILKSPLGVHLTSNCIEIQIDLIEAFTDKAIANCPDMSLVISSLTSLLIILNAHITSLRVCEISFEECAGQNKSQSFIKRIQSKLILIKQTKWNVEKELLSKFLQSNEKLLESITTLLLNDEEQAASRLKETMNEIISLHFREDLQTKMGCILQWISSNNAQEFIAQKFLEKDSKCIALVGQFFSVEEVYLSSKIEDYFNGKSRSIVETLQIAKDELGIAFRKILEKLFAIVSQKLREKDLDCQDAVIKCLYPIVLNHLYFLIY